MSKRVIQCLLLSILLSNSVFAQDSLNIPTIGGLWNKLSHTIKDFQIEENYIFFLDGETGLLIEDISNVYNIQEVGFIDLPSDPEALFISGNYAFVSANSNGMIIVDISEPTTPELVSTIPTQTAICDAYVVNSILYMLESESGLLIYDISQPEDPVHISTIEIECVFENLVVEDELAFIAVGEQGFKIIDVSNPQSPEMVSETNPQGMIVHVAVHDDILYASDQSSGLRIFDISDLENPEQIALYIPSDRNPIYEASPQHICLEAFPIAYFSCEHEGIKILNLSDPYNPEEYPIHLNYTLYANKSLIYDNYLITLTSLLNFIHIYDIDDDPMLVFRRRYSSDIYLFPTLSVINDYLLTVTDYSIYDEDIFGNILLFIDINNPNRLSCPYRILNEYWDAGQGFYTINTYYNDDVLLMTGRYCVMFDISDFPELNELSTFGTTTINACLTDSIVYCLALQDSSAYLNVELYDISNENNPVLISTIDTYSLYGKEINLAGDLLFISEASGYNIQRLTAIDVSDSRNPRLTSQYRPEFLDNPYSSQIHCTTDGEYIFVSISYMNGSNSSRGKQGMIYIMDYSNPEEPEIANTLDLPSTVRDMEIEGDYLYTAGDSAGVRMYDISDVDNITLLGTSLEKLDAREIYVNDGIVYVIDSYHGIRVLDAANRLKIDYNKLIYPSSYFMSSLYPNPFNNNTNLVVNIPKSGFMEINIYDILGRKLYNNIIKQNKGNKIYKIDLNNHSNGIYMLSAKYNNEIKTHKLIYVK
ncbi:MAG: T9SS type A sorting domain-containing protein [Candidatus Electryonea clarkiae]|nr:T9SS type A sorting domain-containing protein [Candidatus Electryonea clarkiae]MDP8288643.1 T9SS type A sorting domain-containing protein [Candidatus Electryonea clarkiae]